MNAYAWKRRGEKGAPPIEKILPNTKIDEMIESLRAAAETLDEMRKAGVTLKDNGGAGDDYATLVTPDPEVAKRFGMEEEREYLDEGDDEGEPPTVAT